MTTTELENVRAWIITHKLSEEATLVKLMRHIEVLQRHIDALERSLDTVVKSSKRHNP